MTRRALIPLRAAATLLAAVSLAACGGRQATPPPSATSAPAPAPAAAHEGQAPPEQGGPGPQILTADLLQRQEIRADKLIAHWAIIGDNPIQSITINGEKQDFPPGDTVTLSKEFDFKISQTVITIAVTDSKGDQRQISYLVVNPGLPIKAAEIVAMAPTKIAEAKAERQRQEPEILKQEDLVRAQFTPSDYTDWSSDVPLNQLYNRQTRIGLYPVWMEARRAASSAQTEYRAVFRSMPTDGLTHRAYWGLTPRQYNALVDELTQRGYRQVFREVLMADQGPWRVQTVWILKASKR